MSTPQYAGFVKEIPGDTKINNASRKNKTEIKIIDQGTGMSEQDIPIAPSTYGTIHNIDYNSTGLYGLGLPIVKMLLDVHDAEPFIESLEGKGTTVTIVFPAYKIIYNKN